ncbi:hypothetical protein TDB9533_04452 [Thalassocella blandensis]|nr:hypothetical protein TDB9533_04452 [Thalassocella blandensis]
MLTDQIFLQLSTELEHVLQTEQADGWEKLSSKISTLDHFDQKQFFYVFAICSRWFLSTPVKVSPDSLCASVDTYKVLQDWCWKDLARWYLLLTLSQKNTTDSYIALYKDLCRNADVRESVMLIQSLALLPQSEAFVENAREAARSNILDLFSAVAHNSQYAYQNFDLSGWNQLILKAAFMAVPIWSIVGLKVRNNEALLTMLKDYARERQAASRTVPWDLWCCVAWAADTSEDIDELCEQFDRGDTQTKAAIVLGLLESDNSNAQHTASELRNDHDIRDICRAQLSWRSIAQLSSS